MASRPVRIGERLAVEVEGLAKAQHRSFANTVAHLIRLGLEQERKFQGKKVGPATGIVGEETELQLGEWGELA